MTFNIKDVLLLSYLTNYDIDFIHLAFGYSSVDDFFYSLNHDPNCELKITDLDIAKAKKKTEKVLQIFSQNSIKAATIFDSDYPTCLHTLNKMPPVVFYKGDLPKGNNVAIVGTRDVSPFADQTVHYIASEFKKIDYGIVSGLALGVDTLAHKAALASSQYTLAVVAHSIENIYPPENEKLAGEILDKGGGILSELPPGINRGKFSFIERNRIQVAFSEIVFPIEMGVKSGTMSTIKFAFELEKPVWVIRPGFNQTGLGQYQGILHLMKMKNKKIQILEPNFNIAEAIKS